MGLDRLGVVVGANPCDGLAGSEPIENCYGGKGSPSASSPARASDLDSNMTGTIKCTAEQSDTLVPISG